MKYTDTSFSRQPFPWFQVGFLLSWFTPSLGLSIPFSSYLENGKFFATLRMTIPGSHVSVGGAGRLVSLQPDRDIRLLLPHPLFLSSSHKGWSIQFPLFAPFIPRVILSILPADLLLQEQPFKYLGVHPLDYRCACKMWVVTLAVWLLCSLVARSPRQANMLLLLQAFSWLHFLTAISPFFALFYNKTPKGCLYWIMPLFSFTPNLLQPDLSLHHPSNCSARAPHAATPTKLTFGPHLPDPAHHALLFEVLSSLGLCTLLAFLLHHWLLLSLLFCFLLFLPTTR